MISISHHAAPKVLEANGTINGSQQSEEGSQSQQIGLNLQRTDLKDNTQGYSTLVHLAGLGGDVG